MRIYSTFRFGILKKSIIVAAFVMGGGIVQVMGQTARDFNKLIDFSNSLHANRLKVSKDTSWHKIVVGANFNQGSFSGNWSGGGVTSAGIGAYFNALFENKVGKNAWRTDLQTQFGFLKNSGQQNRKNQDRIFFDTKYSRELSPKWTLFANVNFQSQFSAGFNYDLIVDSVKVKKQVSGFLSPAYFTQSIGFEYKPDPYFFLNFAPGAFRQTIVWDKDLYPYTPDQKNYGVPLNRRIRYELAVMQIVANYNRDITKQINLRCRYQLYSSILDPLNMDSRLDASLTAKVNKFISANLSAIVAYDEDQSKRVQFAQGLNVGFIYIF